MELEVRFLGPLEIAVDGDLRRLGGRKQRSLLGLLALEHGSPVPVDRLVEALWPRYDPRARARLQVYVSQLRRALGPAGSAVKWRSEGYVLEVAPDAVDAWRFEQLAAAGASALRAGDFETAAGTLRQGLGLWRGGVLEDSADGPLARPEAGRLEQLRLSALEDRVDADLALGRAQDVVAELEALVAEHPLRERLRGQQMLALYRVGRQTDALEVFAAARRMLRDELGLEPGPELRALQAAILRHDPSLQVEPRELRARRHLPAPATALIGRRQQIDDLARMFGTAGVRLVTLTGVGGTGKTRLAIQVAAELAERFEHGVYFVELASLAESALVPQAVIHALDVAERPGEPLEATLARHLRDRRVLLVVDNFEHVEEAAPLIGRLLEAAPDLKVLVTSRAPLRLYGEHEYPVPPLSLPDPAAATGAEAVELFVARAAAALQGFRLTDANAGAVSEICVALDGLPLAIELAAARSRTLTPRDMLASLPARLDLAADGPRDVPPRQQTLRAAIDWSFGLLEPAARDLLARLAVFVGGFTADAAREVCGAGDVALAQVVDHSLLARRVGENGAPRLQMLETVREYAHERLQAADIVRERHADYFVALAQAASPLLTGPAGEHWLAVLEDEHANLRAALAWAREAGARATELRLAGALGTFWEIRGYVREGRAHVEAAIEHAGDQPPALRAAVLAAVAGLALRQGDYARLRSAAGESLELFEAIGDRGGVARSLNRLATAASNEGDYERGASLYERCAAIFRELDDEHGLGVATTNLGCLALMQGDPERAAVLSAAGIAHYKRAGERYAMLHPLLNLALARLAQDRLDEAFERLASGIELASESGYREEVIYFLEGLAGAFVAAGDHERAAKLFGAAHAAAGETGVILEPLEREIHDRGVAAATVALGEAGFGAAQAEGRSLALDAAAAYALDAVRRRTPSGHLAGLGPSK